MAQTIEKKRDASRNWMRAMRARDPKGVRAYNAVWRNANRDRVNELQRLGYHQRRKNDPRYKRQQWIATLRCRYGLESGEFDRLLIEQAGRCAICGAPLIRALVDHNHETGKVRGLLCDGCNLCVGHLENESKRKAALRYLSEHE